MWNVSDAGVKALAEAGCGCGLRTLILGAVWQCPFRSYWGCWIAVWQSDVLLLDQGCCSECFLSDVMFGLCVVGKRVAGWPWFTLLAWPA